MRPPGHNSAPIHRKYYNKASPLTEPSNHRPLPPPAFTSVICSEPLSQRVRKLVIRLCCSCLLSLCLIATVCGMLGVHYYKVISLDTPYRTGSDNVLSLQPGLSVVPQPDRLTSLIRFKVRARYSYRLYSTDIHAFLQWYEPGKSEDNHLMKCPHGEAPTEADKVAIFHSRRYSCFFDVGHGGPCNLQDHYGYDSGVPCVILKINPVYGWIPDLTHSNSTGVKVACQGRTETDRDLIGTLCYFDTDFPVHGRQSCMKHDYGEFKNWYFPFMRQSNYHNPLVFVQFVNITRSVVVMVECRLFNVANARAKVQFEMLVD